MNKQQHDVQDIEFVGNTMTLKVDGKTVAVGLAKVSAALAKAGRTERETFTVSPAGYGIHWPLLDEDLTVDGLLRHARPRTPKAAPRAARQTA